MNESSDWNLEDRVDRVFENIVLPVFAELIVEYNSDGYEAKVVADSPVIMGIEKYSSIMITHPDGVKMIVCVYWVKGSERLTVENISLVTLNRSLNIFELDAGVLKSQIKTMACIAAN